MTARATCFSAPSIGRRPTLCLVPFQDAVGSRERINTPGTVDAANWSWRLPKKIDELLADTSTTERLVGLAEEAGRISSAKK